MGRRGRVRWGDFGGSPQIPLPLVRRDIPLLHRENIYPLIPETKLSANYVPGRSLILPQGLCTCCGPAPGFTLLVTPHLRPG